MEKVNNNKERSPNFDGALVLIFPKSITMGQIKRLFSTESNICFYDDFIEVTYMEVKSILCWEVNDLLTALFARCDIDFILNMQKEYGAKALLDISYHHYDKEPTLIFEGENMNCIQMIKADISIDPY